MRREDENGLGAGRQRRQEICERKTPATSHLSPEGARQLLREFIEGEIGLDLPTYEILQDIASQMPVPARAPLRQPEK